MKRAIKGVKRAAQVERPSLYLWAGLVGLIVAAALWHAAFNY
ncbi:hypothetical protein [Asticcacaulis taihuensis]|nr:hypothetical protein [Asticcacaulis taihuensis]